MSAYYNEIDPFAAQWLRNLIDAKLIARGEVDERSIEDVSSSDLGGFVQCHFFAGIGVWSYALRLAGVVDQYPVWTGSCPCQPFSAAGKRGGAADERHLWPAFFHLIDECRPPIVLGEQVASKDGLAWLDLVSADMEGAGYAFGAADLCAAGVGAPHIRQRLWFVGASDPTRGGWREERPLTGRLIGGSGAQGLGAGHSSSSSSVGRMADDPQQQQHGSGESGARRRIEHSDCGTTGRLDHHHQGSQGYAGNDGAAGGREEPGRPVAEAGVSCWLADSDGGHAGSEGLQRSREHGQQPQDGGAVRLELASSSRWQRREEAAPRHHNDGQTPERQQSEYGLGESGASRFHQPSERTGPVNGFWRNADWLLCRDERWRPVEAGTFPLAHGAPARVGRLRAYGNAIVAEVAATFIEAALSVAP